MTTRYNDLQAQLSETNNAIAGVNAHIGSLDTQAASTQRRIDWNTVQLDAARASLKRQTTPCDAGWSTFTRTATSAT